MLMKFCDCRHYETLCEHPWRDLRSLGQLSELEMEYWKEHMLDMPGHYASPTVIVLIGEEE